VCNRTIFRPIDGRITNGFRRFVWDRTLKRGPKVEAHERRDIKIAMICGNTSHSSSLSKTSHAGHSNMLCHKTATPNSQSREPPKFSHSSQPQNHSTIKPHLMPFPHPTSSKQATPTSSYLIKAADGDLQQNFLFSFAHKLAFDGRRSNVFPLSKLGGSPGFRRIAKIRGDLASTVQAWLGHRRWC